MHLGDTKGWGGYSPNKHLDSNALKVERYF